jgi:hypothetical protein
MLGFAQAAMEPVGKIPKSGTSNAHRRAATVRRGRVKDKDPLPVSEQSRKDAAPNVSVEELLRLQRLAGNTAVTQMLGHTHQIAVQRGNGDEDERPEDRSRRSRPRNAPPGTVPIDQSGLDRETIHKIKDAIGAGPRDWVGITPDGHVVTGDSEGNAEDHGHVSDFARSGAEEVPKWVWGLLAFAAAIALIVLFATGVGEVGAILAGASTVLILAVTAVLRRVRPEQAAPIAALTGADADVEDDVAAA